MATEWKLKKHNLFPKKYAYIEIPLPIKGDDVNISLDKINKKYKSNYEIYDVIVFSNEVSVMLKRKEKLKEVV